MVESLPLITQPPTDSQSLVSTNPGYAGFTFVETAGELALAGVGAVLTGPEELVPLSEQALRKGATVTSATRSENHVALFINYSP